MKQNEAKDLRSNPAVSCSVVSAKSFINYSFFGSQKLYLIVQMCTGDKEKKIIRVKIFQIYNIIPSTFLV